MKHIFFFLLLLWCSQFAIAQDTFYCAEQAPLYPITGFIYTLVHCYTEAVAEYDKGIAVDPHNYEYHLRKARCLAMLNDTATLASYDRALRLRGQGGNEEWYTEVIAERHCALGNYDSAIYLHGQLYRQYLLQQDSSVAYREKIHILQTLDQAGRMAEFAAELEAARQWKGNDIKLRKCEARYAELSGNYQQAIDKWNEIIAQENVQSTTLFEEYLALARLYEKTNQLKEAKEILKKANTLKKSALEGLKSSR